MLGGALVIRLPQVRLVGVISVWPFTQNGGCI